MPFDGGLIAKPKFSFLRWFRTQREDAPEIVRPLTVLDKLGLIPVPADVLEHHKQTVSADFYRERRIHPTDHDRYRWFEFYQADSRMISPNTRSLDCGPTSSLYKNDVLAAVRGMGHLGIGTRVVPRPVFAIADAVTHRANKLGIETEHVAGVFYIDPYLSVVYKEDDEVKRACLAIWDGPRILHIAKLT